MEKLKVGDVVCWKKIPSIELGQIWGIDINLFREAIKTKTFIVKEITECFGIRFLHFDAPANCFNITYFKKYKKPKYKRNLYCIL